jgi:hypothetical protein
MVKSPVATRKENKDPKSSAKKRKSCYVCVPPCYRNTSRQPLIRMCVSVEKLHISTRDLLEDSKIWPDKLLQELCRKIGLQACGERDELITRLRLWHVSKHEGKGFQGSNFYLLPISETTISAEYMSPYRRLDDHERRSILRKRGHSDVAFSTPPQSPCDRVNRCEQRRISDTSPSKAQARKRKKLVQFSPYNRVQLISPRKAGDEEHIRQLYASIQEGAYENSEDEEEEWARTVSNESSSPADESTSSG